MTHQMYSHFREFTENFVTSWVSTQIHVHPLVGASRGILQEHGRLEIGKRQIEIMLQYIFLYFL